MARILTGESGSRYGVVVDAVEGGVKLGLVGSAEQVFEETLSPQEAKGVGYALLLAEDGIKPRG